MQQLRQSTGAPFYDQTNRTQDSSTSSLLLCSCCWPSRRTQEMGQSSEASSLTQKTDKAVVVFKQEVSTLHVMNSPRHSLYLSMNDLNRPPSRNQLEVSTSRLSDTSSINDQPFMTARTSRSTDERRHKSMPELVKEIRDEYIGPQFEEVKQEFMSFFRGSAEKRSLTSTNHELPSSTSNQAPLPPPSITKQPTSLTKHPMSSREVQTLDFSVLSDAENPTTSRSSAPQTSTSTVYEQQSVVPVRPFTSFVQRSLVRLPDHTYRSVLFFYWCLALGFQKLFYGNNPPTLPHARDPQRQFIARNI
ncbi:hypothetical protein M3Y97_00377500 [Aphelenchoides bicaudatus]|nr:hypothetical protein M3Y97_00377500 [Aphelenchoides bicaudatus]